MKTSLFQRQHEFMLATGWRCNVWMPVREYAVFFKPDGRVVWIGDKPQ